MFQSQKCSACGGAFHPATGHAWTANLVLCHSCTQDWMKWLRRRQSQFSAVRKGGTTSFMDAALSSVHAAANTSQG